MTKNDIYKRAIDMVMELSPWEDTTPEQAEKDAYYNHGILEMCQAIIGMIETEEDRMKEMNGDKF